MRPPRFTNKGGLGSTSSVTEHRRRCHSLFGRKPARYQTPVAGSSAEASQLTIAAIAPDRSPFWNRLRFTLSDQRNRICSTADTTDQRLESLRRPYSATSCLSGCARNTRTQYDPRSSFSSGTSSCPFLTSARIVRIPFPTSSTISTS